jgi:hypothetical protein
MHIEMINIRHLLTRTVLLTVTYSNAFKVLPHQLLFHYLYLISSKYTSTVIKMKTTSFAILIITSLVGVNAAVITPPVEVDGIIHRGAYNINSEQADTLEKRDQEESDKWFKFVHECETGKAKVGPCPGADDPVSKVACTDYCM